MTALNQAQAFLNTNSSLLFTDEVLNDNQKYLELVADEIAFNHELNEGEVSIFSDNSCIIRIEDTIKVSSNFNTALDVVEFYNDEYVIIDSTELVSDCEEIVFQDSYGSGVALYNNESCENYIVLAEKAGLDFTKYIGVYFN
ncbi:hypothetical protein [uncultured Shewanella sp.]|uniref:hypothetical protein n=1 Tax=uncultured Shewanella sp. TaxID=173975 RepID=UPI00260267B0|nr:hypothetical protein [uncultured Shewanella sp.]